MNEPDTLAFERFCRVEPAWTAMKPAHEAVGLPRKTLLHCGPPVESPAQLVTPTLNSAAVACVYESWAPTLDAAKALVLSGEVTFAPAQDHCVVTPMATVVSPSMPLIEMTDVNGVGKPAYAPINGGGTGGDPAPRYGRCTPEALTYLKFLQGDVARAMAQACTEPLPWLPLIDAALTEGDDGHLRHGAAHARLMTILVSRLESSGQHGAAVDFMRKWPFFHLNFWMAAVRCVLGACEGIAGSSWITAFGGNGDRFGLQLSALPRQWFSVPATPPLGTVREPFDANSGVGAYGDSAVVEAFGLGAMAHRFAPDMQKLHAGFAPDDLEQLPTRLLAGPHPRMPRSGALVGLCARTVLSAGVTPVVELGIVERHGEGGGLGAGLYRPPLALFEEACRALD